jgi:dihydroorotate dehydrogenase (fumarate)/dihydroorotate dehydrogenase
MGIYRSLVRPVLFRADAERVHDRAIRAAEAASHSRLLCSGAALFTGHEDPRLQVEIAGLRFGHPIGLAAGFDKSGRAVPFWRALGFSHVEIGSVSAEFSGGNPRPRLFRIPEDRGIVVNYGLPNDGAERVAARFEGERPTVPLGINIVNTNRGPDAPAEKDEAILADYLTSVRRLAPAASYLTLNLSCPNTCDGRTFFANAAHLKTLLSEVDRLKPGVPVFLKVAPFGTLEELDRFLELAETGSCIRGFEINLPPGKPPGLTTPAERLASMPGAVSGKPCMARINETLREMYARMDRRRYRIIAAGGVFTAEDAWEKMRLGASAVQLLTAFVYEGPGVVRHICRGLSRMLDREGVRSISDTVGSAAG